MQKDQKNKDRKNLDTLLRKVMKEKTKKVKRKKGVKKLEKKPGTILKNLKNTRTLLAGQKQFM